MGGHSLDRQNGNYGALKNETMAVSADAHSGGTAREILSLSAYRVWLAHFSDVIWVLSTSCTSPLT